MGDERDITGLEEMNDTFQLLGLQEAMEKSAVVSDKSWLARFSDPNDKEATDLKARLKWGQAQVAHANEHLNAAIRETQADTNAKKRTRQLFSYVDQNWPKLGFIDGPPLVLTRPLSKAQYEAFYRLPRRARMVQAAERPDWVNPEFADAFKKGPASYQEYNTIVYPDSRVTGAGENDGISYDPDRDYATFAHEFGHFMHYADLLRRGMSPEKAAVVDYFGTAKGKINQEAAASARAAGLVSSATGMPFFRANNLTSAGVGTYEANAAYKKVMDEFDKFRGWEHTPSSQTPPGRLQWLLNGFRERKSAWDDVRHQAADIMDQYVQGYRDV